MGITISGNKKEQDLYKEEPIKDVKQDCFGRCTYARVIADTISNSGGGFNFGISGEWGSGKSSVLNLVEPLLKKRGFLVVRFNPWKVSTDMISIRRRFLIELVSGLKNNGISVELPENLHKSITRISDVGWKSKISIIWKTALNFLAWFIAIGILPLFAFYGLDELLLYFKIIFPRLSEAYYNILFLPAIGALIQTFRHFLTTIKIESVNPEIEVAEQFEEEFERIIGETKKQKAGNLNLVVIVDDLDRASPKDVMTIFSSIMTFFERKGITFLISADQKMVEIIIKKELGDESNPREFIKKIFQVNWIIPPIPINLQEDFVKSNFPQIVVSKENGVNQLACDWITNMVTNEFGANPRKVRYFMRELEFQIRAVKAMIKDIENQKSIEQINETELKNLKSINEHPELLTKILIVRSSNRFSEVWKKILIEPKRILQIEMGAVDKNDSSIEFLRSRPLFSDYDQNPQYYIYFSGITGFEDRILADPSHLADFAIRGDFEKVKSIMQGTLDIHRIDHLENFIARMKQTRDMNERIRFAQSFCQTLSMLNDPTNRKKILFKFFKGVEELQKQQTFLNNFQSSDFNELVKNFDSNKKSVEQAKKMIEEQPYIQENIKHNVWNGFAEASTALPPKIMTIFCNGLLKNINSSANLQNQIFKTLEQIGPNIEKAENKEDIIAQVIQILVRRPVGQKDAPLNALNSFPDSLNEQNKQMLTNHFSQLGSSDDMQHVTFIIQNIQHIGNVSSKEQVIASLVKRAANRNIQQRQTIVSQLKGIEEQIDRNHRDEIINSLISGFRNPNIREFLVARDIFKGNEWLLPRTTKAKWRIFKEILSIIENKESPLPHELVYMFYSMRQTWEKDKIAKKKFTNILEVFKVDPNPDLANAANKILSDLTNS